MLATKQSKKLTRMELIKVDRTKSAKSLHDSKTILIRITGKTGGVYSLFTKFTLPTSTETPVNLCGKCLQKQSCYPIEIGQNSLEVVIYF